MVFLVGCTHNYGVVSDTITIGSEPQGATVYVDNLDIGATPLTISVEKVFPPRWTGLKERDPSGFASYRRRGTLILKKDGCHAYSAEASELNLSQDIKIALYCDPYRAPDAARTAEPKAAAEKSAPAPAADESIEARLAKLEALRKKALITEQEYQKQRQRILNEL